MISITTAKLYCSEPINLIENYEQAINSDERYELHHRLEIDENKTVKQLKAEGRYFKRPASELIFLHYAEHRRLHHEGTHHTDETKIKQHNSAVGRVLSESHKQNLSISHKGKPSWNKGKKNVQESPIKGKHKVWDNKELNIYHFEY